MSCVGVMETALHLVIFHIAVQKMPRAVCLAAVPPHCEVKRLGGSGCTLASEPAEQAWRDRPAP